MNERQTPTSGQGTGRGLSAPGAAAVVAILLALSLVLASTLCYLVNKIQETTATIRSEQPKARKESPPSPLKPSLQAPAPSSKAKLILQRPSNQLFKQALEADRSHCYSDAAALATESLLAYRSKVGKQGFDRQDKQLLATRYRLRAHCYYKLSNMRQSIDDLTRAMELGPGVVDDYLNRATAYQNLGLNERANQDLSTAQLLRLQEPSDGK